MALTQTQAPLGARLLRVHFGAYDSPEQRERDHDKVLYGYVQNEDALSNWHLMKITPNVDTDWFIEKKRFYRVDENGVPHEFKEEKVGEFRKVVHDNGDTWAYINNEPHHKFHESGPRFVNDWVWYDYDYDQYEDWYRLDNLADGGTGHMTMAEFDREYKDTGRFIPLGTPDPRFWMPVICEEQMAESNSNLFFAKPIINSPWEDHFLYTEQKPITQAVTDKKGKTRFTFVDFDKGVLESTLFHDPDDIRHVVFQTPYTPDIVKQLLGDLPAFQRQIGFVNS